MAGGRNDSPTRASGVFTPADEVPAFLANGWRIAETEDGPVADAERVLLRHPQQQPRRLSGMTKRNPGAFDCYSKAEPDEPMFILLARDVTAPDIVERWAAARERLIELGQKPESDRAMVEEARSCAAQMRMWRTVNRG